MFLFKRKKNKINSKYKLGDLVYFKQKDDLKFGQVYNISLNNDGNIIYSVQIGGECPSVINNILEDKLFTM